MRLTPCVKGPSCSMNTADGHVGLPSESRSLNRVKFPFPIAVAQIVLSTTHFFVGKKAPCPEMIKSYPL